MLERMRSLAGSSSEALRAVRDTGAFTPIRPDRAVRLLFPYLRYGPAPATVGALAALRFPDRTAIIDERGRLTYGELEHRSAAMATALRDRVDAEQRIGILCRNHGGFIEALLAASRLGNDVVLLNTDFSADQLGAVLRREGVGLLVHDQEFTGLVTEAAFTGRRVLAWTDGPVGLDTIDLLAALNDPRPMHASRPSRVIMLTSGTTGTPKGARHDLSLRSLLPAAVTHLTRVRLRSGEPIMIAPPLFHVLGLAYMTAAVGLGMPVVLHRRFDAKEVLAAISRVRAQALITVPVMLQRLLEVPGGSRPDVSSLEVVVCGGSALPPRLSRECRDVFGDVLHNVYGATETGWATIATPEDLRAAPGTVGRPALGLTVRILDPAGREVPPGAIGEIHTGGGLRFAGYTGGAAKEVRDGLTASGDLGHFDEQGRLFIDGRTDDMIVSGGENVFPGEVAELLDRHEAVAEVAVTGVPDDRFGQRLAAYIVRRPGAGLTEDEVKSYVKGRLARFKVPRDVTFVAELPRTTTGKVKTGALHDRLR